MRRLVAVTQACGWGAHVAEPSIQGRMHHSFDVQPAFSMGWTVSASAVGTR